MPERESRHDLNHTVICKPEKKQAPDAPLMAGESGIESVPGRTSFRPSTPSMRRTAMLKTLIASPEIFQKRGEEHILTLPDKDIQA